MLAIFRLEQKATLLREIATMLKAGVPLGEALHVLAGRRAHPRLREAILDGAEHVDKGHRFSEVLANYPDEFSELTAAVIAMGEQTGRLDDSFEQVAAYLEREYKLRQMIMRETFYPKVLLACCIIIPSAIPALIEALTGSVWLGLWIFIKNIGKWALGLGMPIYLAYLVYHSLMAKSQQSREAVDSMKLHIPLLGPVVRRLALAKFARALSYTYSAGVPMGEAIALSASAMGNSILERRFKNAVPLVQRGQKLSEALGKAPDIDDMAMRMLRTGEQTGELDATMERVADHFEVAAETSIHRMAIMALPIGVIFVGIIIGYIVISFYVQYYSGF